MARGISARKLFHWVYGYLFAKQDRTNIEGDELAAFRILAKSYACLTDAQLNALLENRKKLVEICHDA
jgi:hypothetical protein